MSFIEKEINGLRIKEEDYKYDYVYDNNLERYFDEISVMKEYYKEHNMPLPKYVFGCYPIEFSLDMYNIVKNELEDNHYEDAFDHIDSESLNSLQKLVDNWTKEQGVVSYDIDYETVILISDK